MILLSDGAETLTELEEADLTHTEEEIARVIAEYAQTDLRNTSVPFWGHKLAEKLLETDGAIVKFPLWVVSIVFYFNFQIKPSFYFCWHS